MLSRFEILLSDKEREINRNMASLFHGALMELLPPEYADKLHENGLKPFSQYIVPCGEGARWYINCLNDECAEHINTALMRGTESIHIKNKDITSEIISRNLSTMSYKSFIDKTYFSPPPRSITVFFNTPTAFKENGRYVIFPNMGAIYKNLIRKFDAFSTEYSIYDEETLESLTEMSNIFSYKLQSTAHHMESVKIPSFTGRISVGTGGRGQLASLACLLLSYGEYAGIGIKTALGMGAVQAKRGE
ncbi:MAG: CRISPR-associated endoribonuclease Cas6 [Firmicutes bacterium]|nr:CRISPR-associated endoribonuclease Cas6 [Bacillota bacterium]